MTWLFDSGRIFDFLFIGMVIEAVFLVAWHRRTGHGIQAVDTLSNICAGACLIVAMRLAWLGAWWGFVGLALAGSLAGHVVVLRRGWVK